MAKVLKLKFQNEKGKNKILTISHPKEGLTADVVRGAMQKIAEADIFEKEDVKMYVKPVKAYYTTTTDDQIFEDEVEEANAE